MSTYQDLLAAVKTVGDRTGDPNAWQAGLTPTEVAAAMMIPAVHSEQLDAILDKIRRQHPDVFGAVPGEQQVKPPPPDGSPADQHQGAAAEAIADAEAALAHQNSASSQLDLQVISAILNAHLKTVEGREALTALQRDTEAAVRTRSDLDTPAGARDFQRFLIGKLRDIRAVVAGTNLDDTSKSALMAAWTSLYDASRNAPGAPGETPPATPPPVAAPARGVDPPEAGWDPALDSLLGDPGQFAGDAAPPDPGSGTAAPVPAMVPTTPSLPNFGGAPMPGAGAVPSGFALPALDGGRTGLPGGFGDDPTLDDSRSPDHASSDEPDDRTDDDPVEDQDHEAKDAEPQQPDTPPTGPTSVTLPDGETVTAASPQLAAAIKAAAGGVPIADAFQQQGITIPAPGTAVANPIDPTLVTPGDIGIFTDHHALALGNGKALLEGQIQQITTVNGPSFLGWEHPPTPATVRGDGPTPTRPAVTLTT